MSAIPKKFQSADCTRYRWSVFSRTLAASAGGYCLTSLFSAVHASILNSMGIARVDAALSAMLCAFLIYAVIVVTVFHASSATRAWVLLIKAAVPLALIAMLLSLK